MKHLCLNLKRFDVPVPMGGVNRLAEGNVRDLGVSEPDLEEIFLHYYQDGGEDQ